MTPYYDRDGITLYHGDCRAVLPTLAAESVAAVVTDPPYGEAMGYAGDATVGEAGSLLDCCLRATVPALERSAHLAVFWTMRTLDVCIEAVKAAGLTYRRVLAMYLPKGGARPYLGWLPRTQAIVIGQKYLSSAFHTELARHLSEAVQRSGKSNTQIARALGCDSRLVMKWTRVGDPAWCLPTPRFYGPLKKLLGLDDAYDVLLDRQTERANGGRRDYKYRHDLYRVEAPVAERSDHPSAKPLDVVRHIVTCVAATGALVLDPFVGSGTTLLAARLEGRRAVGVEIDERYCELTVRRLERT